jgi:hypothetical protein
MHHQKQHNLRLGALSALEHIVEFLNQTPQLQFRLGLVEIKTTVEPTGITISLPPAEASAKRERITEEDFFAELGRRALEAVEFGGTLWGHPIIFLSSSDVRAGHCISPDPMRSLL